MHNLKDSKLDKSTLQLRCLVYGFSGAGKTTFAGTFPSPAFIFDFDHKLKPLYGKDIDVESFDCEAKSKAKPEFDRFMALFVKIKQDPKYATIIIDSLTLLDPLAIQWLIGKSGKVMERPTLEIYGLLNDFYNYFFLSLNIANLKKNVVVTAHEQYLIDEDSGVHRVTPLITGQKMLGKLPNYFEEVYHMTAKEGGKGTIRQLYYRPHGKAIANSLILRGEGSIEEPTYEKLVQQVE